MFFHLLHFLLLRLKLPYQSIDAFSISKLDLLLSIYSDNSFQMFGWSVCLFDVVDPKILFFFILLEFGLDFLNIINIFIALSEILDNCQTLLTELTFKFYIKLLQFIPKMV